MDILFGIQQRSIPGPLLFSIFLGDMFLFQVNTDFVCYDDKTRYCLGKKSPEEAIATLGESS